MFRFDRVVPIKSIMFVFKQFFLFTAVAKFEGVTLYNVMLRNITLCNVI